MRKARVTVVLIALSLVATPAAAQLPVATGRQLGLSDPAWKVFIPSTYAPRAGNVADVLVHFHGDSQTYWNNAKYADLNTIIVTVNYSGLSSAYTTPFSNAALFGQILTDARNKVRAENDFPDALEWDKVGVSSFSAGYGAVREILKSATYRNDIDALLAADSLYATTAGDGTPVDSQLADYKTYATAAKNGTKTFLFSHSQVPTFTYESTGECGDELMQHLGITPTNINTNGLGTLNFNRAAQTGNFRLWGATGTDGDSHLEHLRYVGEFLKEMPLAKLTQAVPVAGDYNSNGEVDAADYVIWRKTLGSTTNMAANGDNSARSLNVINEPDFLFWQKVFGSGSSGGGSVGPDVIPEPASWLIVSGLVALTQSWQRRARAFVSR